MSARARLALGASLTVLLVIGVLGALVVADRLGVRTPLSGGGQTRLTITTGSLAGRRNEIAQAYLAPAAESYGLNIRIVATIGSEDSLDKVNSGTIDLALVGGGLAVNGRENVREIMPLYVEPLHLLLRPGAIAYSDPNAILASELRNQTISLDLVGTGTHTLVAPPAGLLGQLGIGIDDFIEVPKSLDELADPKMDCGGLPAAIFVLGPLPHPGAANLISHCDYHLQPLPFAEALHITHIHIFSASVPAATYRLDPPEPASALPTIGTQLLLVANKDVPDSVIQKLLAAVLETSFSHLYDPPLDIGQLSLVPEFPQHPGVEAYITSRQPVTLEGLTTASKLIAVVTSAIPITLVLLRALTQWRQRDQISSLRHLIAEVSLIERDARKLEWEPDSQIEATSALRTQLVRLRTTAMHRSSANQLQNLELLPAFLHYVAETQDVLERLERRHQRAH